jgi:hypothetical protein
MGCNPYICGLHIFQKDGIDSENFEDLKQKISVLQSQGAFVKLAMGGQEWGNTIIAIKVKKKSKTFIKKKSFMVIPLIKQVFKVEDFES